MKPEYWKWRAVGMNFKLPVRYPNGFQGRKRCVCTLWPDDEVRGTEGVDYVTSPEGQKYAIYGYVEARVRVYFSFYKELVKRTKLFRKIREDLKTGKNFQILEVEGPRYNPVEYPHCEAKNNSLIINEKSLLGLINNTSQNFSHGYCFAASLLDFEFEL